MEQLELLIVLLLVMFFVWMFMKYEVPWREEYTYLEVAIAYDVRNVHFYQQGPFYQPSNLSFLYHKSPTIDKLIG